MSAVAEILLALTFKVWLFFIISMSLLMLSVAFIIFIYSILEDAKIFTCPCCDGKGGYTEPVIDFGQGPYYPCDFCNDEEKVGLKQFIRWHWDCTIMENVHKLIWKFTRK